MRQWRKHVPGICFGMGVLLGTVRAFFTNWRSTCTRRIVGRGVMLAAAPTLGLVHGRLKSQWWGSRGARVRRHGDRVIVHEQKPVLFARSRSCTTCSGGTFSSRANLPAPVAWKPRCGCWQECFAMTIVTVAIMLFSDRDVQPPVFGHLSPIRRTADHGETRAIVAFAELAFPAAAWRKRRSSEASANSGPKCTRGPTVIRLHFDQK